MGGKPSKGTPADRRLSANRSGGAKTSRSYGSSVGRGMGMKPMPPAVPKTHIATTRRGTPKHG
jgi:hypothetical protein